MHDTELMTKYTEAELDNMYLAYVAAHCRDPAAQRLYVERYPMRCTLRHNFFAYLHRRLAEIGSLQKAVMNRARSARTSDIEKNMLHQVGRTPSLSTQSVVHAIQVSCPNV